VANAGASVLFTIHQPASEIFNSFDHLLLLNRGALMYHGPVTEVSQYFAERGFSAPPNFSTADWIMNVAQANTTQVLVDARFFERSEMKLAELGLSTDGTTMEPMPSSDAVAITNENHVSFWVEVMMLYRREILAILRDTGGTIARFVVTAVLATLIGTIFFGVGRSDPEDPNVSGCLLSPIVHGVISYLLCIWWNVPLAEHIQQLWGAGCSWDLKHDGLCSKRADEFSYDPSSFSPRVLYKSLFRLLVLYSSVFG
jgi:ABC-2 type transporter